jgi:hypothetical protein
MVGVSNITAFGTEIILIFIGCILGYIALKIRKADTKLDKIERTMFGLPEVEQEKGIVQMVHTHREALEEENILQDEENLTLDNIDEIIRKLREVDRNDFNEGNNAD